MVALLLIIQPRPYLSVVYSLKSYLLLHPNPDTSQRVLNTGTSMHTKTIDFISLYNAFWYRDFPVVDGPIDFAKRADWTTHIEIGRAHV